MTSANPEPLSQAKGPSPLPTDADSDLRDVVNRAVSVLMALLPCSAAAARQVLFQAARAPGVSLERVARAAEAMRGEGPAPSAAVEAALRAATERLLMVHANPSAPVLLPNPHTLRHRLSRFHDLRRLAFASPDDATLRARYEDAGYTLCVMLGHRTVHGALAAAEQLVDAPRLADPGDDGGAIGASAAPQC
ncbi:DUF5133 domain-containing protein [Streptomyces sp. NBC_00160]|uniref:DUF5133 domain-containing protein n=1 Tax=Streptomyces sp. NBC_00160 TaxID=2903628 RepID=UPI002259397E|nr:DUF5133 domain-containing protein [Streptomyces sp. NBC_00160]MCX5309081.1 DUF5133 domain-containing protein [Streptomyces sp. NBC_00160]